MFQELLSVLLLCCDLGPSSPNPNHSPESAAVDSGVTSGPPPLDSDWLVLVVLAFDNKDLLGRNRHHINEVFQDHCGHAGQAGEARACALEGRACASYLTSA